LISAREVCKDNIENYQIELDALSERLKNIKVYNVSDIQNKKQAEEKRVKHIEAKTSEFMVKQKKLIYQYGMILFGYKLANDTMLNITEKEVLGEIPSPYDESLINKIIEAKLCICGREVNPLSSEYEHIKSLRNKANTADIKQKRLAAVHFAGSIGNLSEKPQEFIAAYQDIDKEIANLLREKQISTLEILDLQQQLEDIGDGGEREVATINKEIHSISTQKENAKIRMSNIEKNISVLNTRIGECDRWIGSNAPDNDLVYKYNRDIEKLEKLVRLCESKLKNYEVTARNNIAVSVNVILNNFSRKEFNVRVTENFDFKLARPDGSLVAKSKGENLLLNLSFVSALLGFCAQRASGDNRFLIKGTVAPFFIDAPFGELDDTYRQATAIFLPQCCEQLILLLSSSHWSGTVDSSIKDRVGKEYLIISHKTEKQNEKPSDLIEIKNIAHQQSIYESDFEGSLIKEI
jgi:DNA repair exonuclease SbcCD ATPase subunit